MNRRKLLLNRQTFALFQYVTYCVVLLLIASCRDSLQLHSKTAVEIDYENNNQFYVEWQWIAQQRRDSQASTRLTFEYINRQNDLFRPFTYRLWLISELDEPTQKQADDWVDNHYDRPTYTVSNRDNDRCYARAMIRSGWYVAEINNSRQFCQFHATFGSDGLLIYTESNPDESLLTGYYPSYGKIKFSFGRQHGIGAKAFLSLAAEGTSQTFQLYAQDGNQKEKFIDWFLPRGNYIADWYKKGTTAHKSGNLTIISSKTYPHLKL